jgi:hypothetical protein
MAIWSAEISFCESAYIWLSDMNACFIRINEGVSTCALRGRVKFLEKWINEGGGSEDGKDCGDCWVGMEVKRQRTSTQPGAAGQGAQHDDDP